MDFLGFCSGFELLTTKTAVTTKKKPPNSILRDSLTMVVFLVFLGVYCGFGGFSWLLAVCRECYRRFGG